MVPDELLMLSFGLHRAGL